MAHLAQVGRFLDPTTHLATAGLVSPIEGSLGDLRLDFLTLAGLTAVAIVFLRTERVIPRVEGGLLTAVYASFLVLLVVL